MVKQILITFIASICLVTLPACPLNHPKSADKTEHEAAIAQKDEATIKKAELIPFRENKKWGLKDKISGNVAVPAKYDEIDIDMGNGFFLVGIEGKGRGFLDETGQEIIPLKYDCISYEVNQPENNGNHQYMTSFMTEQTDSLGLLTNRYFINGMVIVGHTEISNGYRTGNALLGYIDETGKEIVTPCYSQAFPLVEGLALVIRRGSGVGYIDETGKEVIPCMYNSGAFFNEGKAQVKLKGEEFFIDKTGKRLP